MVITLYNLLFPIQCSRNEITKKLVSSESEYFRALGGFEGKSFQKRANFKYWTTFQVLKQI